MNEFGELTNLLHPRPFPTMQRLIRHLREIHVYKQHPRFVLPENRGKNFTPRKSFTQNTLFGSKTPTTNLVIQQPCHTQSKFFNLKMNGTQANLFFFLHL